MCPVPVTRPWTVVPRNSLTRRPGRGACLWFRLCPLGHLFTSLVPPLLAFASSRGGLPAPPGLLFELVVCHYMVLVFHVSFVWTGASRKADGRNPKGGGLSMNLLLGAGGPEACCHGMGYGVRAESCPGARPQPSRRASSLARPHHWGTCCFSIALFCEASLGGTFICFILTSFLEQS